MKHEFLQALGNVSATQLALESLRANDIDRALEALERNLDAGLLVLNRADSDLSSVEREIVASTLRRVRDYRKAHPRRVEDLGLGGRGALEAQGRVTRILHEIE